MDKRAITDRLDYAIRLIQYARRLLLEAYNKSKARIIDLANEEVL